MNFTMVHSAVIAAALCLCAVIVGTPERSAVVAGNDANNLSRHHHHTDGKQTYA